MSETEKKVAEAIRKTPWKDVPKEIIFNGQPTTCVYTGPDYEGMAKAAIAAYRESEEVQALVLTLRDIKNHAGKHFLRDVKELAAEALARFNGGA